MTGTTNLGPGTGATGSTGASASLSTRLREATADQHSRAEKHTVQQDLVRGKAEPAQYAAWLRAMRVLHERFETTLMDARAHALVGPAIEDHHFRLTRIDEDLDALAVLLRGDTAPHSAEFGPRTRAAWAQIETQIASDPVAILGPFYVLEGSTNGGRFIAQAIRHSLPLPPNAGTRYLDPHGELIRERWAAAKAALDALPLSSKQHDEIVLAAQRTFETVTHLMDELDRPAAS